jgi:hypothetical protein
MYRVMVFYEEEPDAEAYAGHAVVCRSVPNGVFRHGRVLGSPMGEPRHAYYAEWEFPDRDAFDAAVRSDEFIASGKDAAERGLPRPFAEFLEVE